MAVRAAAQACGARLVGAEIGSREIEFWPGEIGGRTAWRLDVGTAGSLTLVLQCLLPALSHAPEESTLTLIGGTDVPFSPPFDYFREVFLPALEQLGSRTEARLVGRGFYPKGGGEVQVRVPPSPILRAVSWRERGPVTRIRGRVCSLGLPAHIGQRMREAALATLGAAGHREAGLELEVVPSGRSEGCAIVLWAECEGGRRLAGSGLGRRGKRAEEVGREAAGALIRELSGRGAVDSHLADQLIVWVALADGPSEFTTSRVTDHLRSAAQVAEAVVGARVEIEEGEPVRVRCEPTGS
jgi:RNA 3'-phosphate cyclase